MVCVLATLHKPWEANAYGCRMKTTLILLTTLLLVFVLGYMVGTSNARPHVRSAPIMRPNSEEPNDLN